jgi:hypothetical protein
MTIQQAFGAQGLSLKPEPPRNNWIIKSVPAYKIIIKY